MKSHTCFLCPETDSNLQSSALEVQNCARLRLRIHYDRLLYFIQVKIQLCHWRKTLKKQDISVYHAVKQNTDGKDNSLHGLVSSECVLYV